MVRRVLTVMALIVVVLWGAGADAEEVLVKLKEGEYLLLVEKDRHTLTIYDHTLKPLSTYRVTTGKVAGDKQKEGDLKTPEGVYFFTEYIDGRRLHQKYGVGALVMDYPNPFDRLKGKGGYGIWLHATDEPERINRPRDTRGCVVTTDEDFLRIKALVRLGATPVVVVKKAELRDGAPLAEEIKEEAPIEGTPISIIALRDMAVVEDGKKRLYLLSDRSWRIIKTEPVND